jgi:hypothetical protein
VQVGVVLEGLPPGVQDGQEADPGAEVRRVGGDLEQGVRGGAEQQAVDHPRVLQGDRPEGRREGKDDMEVGDGEQLGRPRLDPPRRLGGLALGAVAVAARVVSGLPMAAPVAGLDVSAQRRRAAPGQVGQGAPLLRGERAAVRVAEGVAVLPDDVGDLEPGPGHGRGPPPASRSSRSRGLTVARTAAGETWA